MYPELRKSIEEISKDLHLISKVRKAELQVLSTYIQEKRDKDELVSLIFICTHNSRRSHLTQVWAQIMAAHFGLSSIQTYSGGTEATACYKSTLVALKNAGVQISELREGNNPLYSLKYDANHMPMLIFSKVYDHHYNPNSDFAAIMTCNDADVNCPYIPEANQRIKLTYVDPKFSDGTEAEESTYLAKSREIAREMYYIMEQCN